MTRRTRMRLVLVLRTVAYVAIALSGLAIILTDFPIFYTIMGWWCLVGGLCSSMGSATGRWVGEFVGLPLLSSAMLTFAGLTYRDSWDAVGWVSIPSVLLLFAYGVLLAGRWLDVQAVGRAAKEAANARH